jgi:hypothetical protein
MSLADTRTVVHSVAKSKAVCMCVCVCVCVCVCACVRMCVCAPARGRGPGQRRGGVVSVCELREVRVRKGGWGL